MTNKQIRTELEKFEKFWAKYKPNVVSEEKRSMWCGWLESARAKYERA